MANIRKIILGAMCFACMFGAACSKTKETDTVPEDAAMEQDAGGEVELVEKNAFLLENTDIFFAEIPQGWTAFQTEQVLADIYCPDKSILGEGFDRFYWLRVERRDALWKKPWYGIAEEQEVFVFPDGEMGDQYVIENEPQYAWYLISCKENGYEEAIGSADGNYLLRTNMMTKEQHEEYLLRVQNVYENIVFQSGQIGAAQEKPIGEREKVVFHANGRFGFDTRVPEGISFQINEPPKAMNTEGSYEMYLYLDDGGENYVKVFDDSEDLAPMTDLIFYECGEKQITGGEYAETAEYVVHQRNSQIFYVYSFFRGNMVQIRVPEEDAEMLAAALDIVKNMRWRK